jgi:ATP-binding protein involved in chromosome partitioning
VQEAIRRALDGVIDPELRKPITELGMVGDIAVDGINAIVNLKLTIVGCPAAQKIERDTIAAASKVDGIENVSVVLGVMTAAERETLKEQLRGGRAVRTNPFDEDTYTRVYLVGSGKGGVGKSSITANLAVALAAQGHKVGLIDADIFGFSIPGQLGITSKPTKVDDLILPPVFEIEDGAGFVKVISIGMFVEEGKAVAWRGPMLHRAIQQFLTDVHWGDLDFLLVDLPPGTGDVAISLGQLLPTAKSIVVTTPQPAAADIAARTAAVGLQTGQRILGVIENMSWLENPDGSRTELFGSGGGAAVAKQLSELAQTMVPLLGQIAMSQALREGSDKGQPVVLSHPQDLAAEQILQIASLIAQDKLERANRSLKLNL